MKVIRNLFLYAPLFFIPHFVFGQGGDGAFSPILAGDGMLPFSTENLDLVGLISNTFELILGIAAVLAVVKIVIAGSQYMFSEVVTNKENAKKDIQGALLGLLIVLASLTILNEINPSIVEEIREDGLLEFGYDSGEIDLDCNDMWTPDCEREGNTIRETARNPDNYGDLDSLEDEVLAICQAEAERRGDINTDNVAVNYHHGNRLVGRCFNEEELEVFYLINIYRGGRLGHYREGTLNINATSTGN